MKYVKTFFRLLLGLFMTYAGISHLTIARQEFVAQVPTWLQFSPGFTDFVVLASGVVEIALGLGIYSMASYSASLSLASRSERCTSGWQDSLFHLSEKKWYSRKSLNEFKELSV